jgi:oligoendopeptidase F
MKQNDVRTNLHTQCGLPQWYTKKKETISLTQQDLHAINGLLQEQNTEILGEVDKKMITLSTNFDAKLSHQKTEILSNVNKLLDSKLEQQTKDIAQVINTVLLSADSTFATKLQLRNLSTK